VDKFDVTDEQFLSLHLLLHIRHI